MPSLFRVIVAVSLRKEARNASDLTEPPVELETDEIVEALGEEISETIGAKTFSWIKVRNGKGEGFATRNKLEPLEQKMPPDDALPEHMRRKIELGALAQVCFDSAFDHGSNSSLLMAMAFLASGKEWNSTHANAADRDGMVGIYRFTAQKWQAGLDSHGNVASIPMSMMTSSVSQCELTALMTAGDWKKLELMLARPVRGVDLLLSYLTSVNVAAKCLLSSQDAVLKTVLPESELQNLMISIRSMDGLTEAIAEEPVSSLIEKLAIGLDAGFEFVRKFASELLPTGETEAGSELSTTTDDVLEEEPVPGEDSDLPDNGSVDPVANVPLPNAAALEEGHLVALWRRSMFPIDDQGIILFGIRGCLPVDFSGTPFQSSHVLTFPSVDYKEMRCTIGQWSPGKGIALFPGSTVPFTDLIKSRVKHGGTQVNQMGRGRHLKYAPEFHKRSEGKGGHWAILQESDCTLQRTSDNATYDKDDRWDVDRPGDNIHCAFHMGGPGAIPRSVFSSAGCQVVAGTVKKGKRDSESGPWKKFIEPFKPGGQKSAEYVLFSGDEVRQMMVNQYAGKTVVLRFGSQGPLVKELQERLAAATGKPIEADGKFGKNTFLAVISFQQKSFGPNADDGIVGPETAAKLGMTLPMFDFKQALLKDTGVTTEFIAAVGGQQGLAEAMGAPFRADFIQKFAPIPSSAQKRERYDRYIKFLTSDECMAVLEDFEIAPSKRRIAHFLAQGAQETGGFTLFHESLFYTTIGAVREAFEVRASAETDLFIKTKLLRNEEAMGEWAYGDRLGNRPGTGDGFAFRGGGFFQTTGRENFERTAKRLKTELGIDADLGANPELIEDVSISMRAACLEWRDLDGNALADADDVRRISRGINRGNVNATKPANGEAERIAMLAKVKAALGI